MASKAKAQAAAAAELKSLLSDDMSLLGFKRRERAILAIYAYQTATEKVDQATEEDNGVGFTGADAEILSSFAAGIIRSRYCDGDRLSLKQDQIAARKLAKYAGQLLRIAAINAAAKESNSEEFRAEETARRTDSRRRAANWRADRLEAEIAAAEDYAASLRPATVQAAGDPLAAFVATGVPATEEIAQAFSDWSADFPGMDRTSKLARVSFAEDYRQNPDSYGPGYYANLRQAAPDDIAELEAALAANARDARAVLAADAADDLFGMGGGDGFRASVANVETRAARLRSDAAYAEAEAEARARVEAGLSETPTGRKQLRRVRAAGQSRGANYVPAFAETETSDQAFARLAAH
jgi:hypothetical protein